MATQRARSLALLLCGASALAQPMQDPSTPHERIDQQRRAAVTEYEAARRDCATTFQVTRCTEQARSARDAKLEVLRQEQLSLDDQQRRQRAAERERSLQDKATQAQSMAASAPSTPRSAARAASASPAPSSAGRASNKPLIKRSEASARAASSAASATAAREASKRAQYQRRVDEAAAHRAALAARNSARDARKPPAAGLPASAPSTSGR